MTPTTSATLTDEVVAAIARELGPEWHVYQPTDDDCLYSDAKRAYLHKMGTDDLLLLRTGYSLQGRIEVSGSTEIACTRGALEPGQSLPYPDNPSITCSLSRAPRAIARAIARCVLPGYREQMQLAYARAQETRELRAERAAAAAALRVAGATEHTKAWPSHDTSRYLGIGPLSLEVHQGYRGPYGHGATVEIKGTGLTVSQARRIVRALAEEAEERAAAEADSASA